MAKGGASSWMRSGGAGGSTGTRGPEDVAWARVSDPAASEGDYVVSDAPGAEATLSFSGTGLSLRAVFGPARGRAQIWLDGSPTADGGPLRAHPAIHVDPGGVGPQRTGRHVARVVVLGTRHRASQGIAVTIDRWVVAEGSRGPARVARRHDPGSRGTRRSTRDRRSRSLVPRAERPALDSGTAIRRGGFDRMPKGILERLAEGPVLGDGGYLLELEKRGYVQAGPFTPEVVVEHPEALAQLHREFLRAGAEVLQTMTFYASDDKLATVGMEGTVDEINRNAVRIARRGRVRGRCAWSPATSRSRGRTTLPRRESDHVRAPLRSAAPGPARRRAPGLLDRRDVLLPRRSAPVRRAGEGDRAFR